MDVKLVCLLTVLALAGGLEVSANSKQTGRGRHTRKELSDREKSTKGKVSADCQPLAASVRQTDPRITSASPPGKRTKPEASPGAEKIPPFHQADVCEDFECDPGKQCVVTADGEATCTCIKECRREVVRPLCASDGVTYTSDCEIRRAACRDGVQLFVVHEGMCGPLPTDTPITATSPSPRRRPIACYQDQRDTLQREVVEWLLGTEASDGPGARPYETVLEDFFTQFDDSEDDFLEPTEFLKFVEHNETLREATDDLNRDLEEDTLLRGLCVDALLEEADENFDWRLSLVEFKEAMMPGFSPPTRMCSLEGEYFRDGEEKRKKCNLCICACGNWVCTANACDGSAVAGEADEDRHNEDERVSDDTWLEITSMEPLKLPTVSQTLGKLAAKTLAVGDETAVDRRLEDVKEEIADDVPEEATDVHKEFEKTLTTDADASKDPDAEPPSLKSTLAGAKDTILKIAGKLRGILGRKRGNGRTREGRHLV